MGARRVQSPNFDQIDDAARIMQSAKWPDFLNVDLSVRTRFW